MDVRRAAHAVSTRITAGQVRDPAHVMMRIVFRDSTLLGSMSISSENQALPASVPTLGLKRKAFKAPLAVRPAVSNIPPAAREDAGPKPVSASEEHYYFNV